MPGNPARPHDCQQADTSAALYCCPPPPPPPWSLMVSSNCWDADWPLRSVTFMVKVNLPAWVGVPASWLLLSSGALVDRSASPGRELP